MNIFKQWMEKDLTRLALRGLLPRAVEVDDAVLEVEHALDADLHVAVTGAPGVGKTSLVYEVVSRAAEGRGAARLRGCRVIQISLRRRLLSLQRRDDFCAEAHKLVEAVRRLRRPPVLFIRDLPLAYAFDLETAVTALAYSGNVLMLGEGGEDSVAALFEYETALRQRFAMVRMEEPGLDRGRRIVRGWAERQRERVYTDDALEHALTLSYRFLTRGHLPRKAIDLLTQASADVRAGCSVMRDHVVRRLSSQHRIPRMLIDPAAPLDLPGWTRALSRRVIGQPEAVAAVVDTLGVIKAGMTDVQRPLSAMLFAGPTGVGKTLIARVLSEQVFGHGERFIRFNMADYQTDSDVALLFGWSGPGERSPGQLAARLAGHSMGVVLLDEFEKAHPSLHDRFLQLIDEGEFVNGAGERVPCRSFMIIVTTNAGEAHGTAARMGLRRDDRSLMDRLSAHFRFELLNRFDRIVRFRSLSRGDARSIVIAKLRDLQGRMGLAQQGVTLEIERRAVERLVELGYRPACGARNLRRVVEQVAAVAISRVLVEGCVVGGARIRLVLCDGAVVARLSASRPVASQPVVSGPRLARPGRGRVSRPSVMA